MYYIRIVFINHNHEYHDIVDTDDLIPGEIFIIVDENFVI